ncbi:hypothetical protein ACPA9J_23200 [Pseudomonas aeruginosa]
MRRPEPSVWWQAGPPCTPWSTCRAARVSGPVQEDKAEAHAVLKRLVRVSHSTLDSVDLKTIEGVCSREILVRAPCTPGRPGHGRGSAGAYGSSATRISSGQGPEPGPAAFHQRRQHPPAPRPPGNGERLFWAGERQACASSPRRSFTPAAANWN